MKWTVAQVNMCTTDTSYQIMAIVVVAKEQDCQVILQLQGSIQVEKKYTSTGELVPFPVEAFVSDPTVFGSLDFYPAINKMEWFRRLFPEADASLCSP